MVALGSGYGSTRGRKGEQRHRRRRVRGGGRQIARRRGGRGAPASAAGKRGRRDGEEREKGMWPAERGDGARLRGRNIPSDGSGERGDAGSAGQGRVGEKGEKDKGGKERKVLGEEISRKIETKKGFHLYLETESKYRLYLETEKKIMSLKLEMEFLPSLFRYRK